MNRITSLQRPVLLGVTALAIAWIVALSVIMLWRWRFPLELEWMEGGLLHQAYRAQRGEAMYSAPSAAFVPFLYPPIYPWVLALLGSILPLDYGLSRAVSLVSVVGLAWAYRRALLREGKPIAHIWITIGLLASSYRLGYRWYDVGRPDMLCMALATWGVVMAREAWGDHRKAFGAALLLTAAIWTKQTALPLAIATGLGMLVVAPRQVWTFVATLIAFNGLAAWQMQEATSGWFWHYVVELHQHHAFNEERFYFKTWGMFLHAQPWIALVVLVATIELVRPWAQAQRRLDDRVVRERRRQLEIHRGWLFWAWMMAAGLLVSALGYATQWAEPNAFIPGIVFIALFVGVAIPRDGIQAIIILGLIGVQLVFCAVLEPNYQPIQTLGVRGLNRSYHWPRWARAVPTHDAFARARTIRHELEHASGPVFAWHRPWWSIIAGGTGHIGAMAIHDVLPVRRAALQAEVRTMLASGHFEQIWLDSDPPRWMRPALAGYQVEQRWRGHERLAPWTGYMSRAGMASPYRGDQLLLSPIAARPLPPSTRVIADFEDGTQQQFRSHGSWSDRPIRSIHGRLPMLGRLGGEYLLSSATTGGLSGRGLTGSPTFSLPERGVVRVHLATAGDGRRLSATLVDAQASHRTVSLPLPAEPWILTPVTWEIPGSWAGRVVRLELRDEAPNDALFVDDLWVTTAAAPSQPGPKPSRADRSGPSRPAPPSSTPPL